MQTKIIRGQSRILKSIETTAKHYASVKARMHSDAVSCFVHIVEHRDTRALNAMFQYLPKNYQTALRVWMGDNSKYIDSDGKEKNWIKFSTKDGFRVTKGSKELTDAVAERYHDQKETDMTPFYDAVDNEKDKPPLDLVALLKLLAKSIERVEKKAEDEHVALPSDIMTQMGVLETLADGYLSSETQVAGHA